jgi:hypothetical protein
LIWPDRDMSPWAPSWAVSSAQRLAAPRSEAQVPALQAAREYVTCYHVGTVGRRHWETVLELLEGRATEPEVLARPFAPGQVNAASLVLPAPSGRYAPPSSDTMGICLGDLMETCPEEFSPLAAVNTARAMVLPPSDRASALARAVRHERNHVEGTWSWRCWHLTVDLISGLRTESEVLLEQFPMGSAHLVPRTSNPIFLSLPYDDRRPEPVAPKPAPTVVKIVRPKTKSKAKQLSLFDGEL